MKQDENKYTAVEQTRADLETARCSGWVPKKAGRQAYPNPNRRASIQVCSSVRVCVCGVLMSLAAAAAAASLATQLAYAAASINYCCCLSCTEILVSV